VIEILNILKDTILGYWWIIAPVALFFILRNLWLSHVRDEFLKTIKWTILEIKFPQEAAKSPKAIEQFFNGLHAVERKLKFKDKYLKGELPTWFSIEIIGREGAIHIFVRTPDKFRNLVESQIYAQYPDAEISEAEDYINTLPKDIPNKDYDIWGTELILTQPDAYPIRTYPVFFEEKEIEERTDPIAGLFEFLSSLNSQEHAWIQILISPTDDKWKKEGEELVAKLIGKKVKATKRGLIMQETASWLQAFVDGISEFLFGAGGGESKAEEKTLENIMAYLSPGQKEVVLAVEKNIAKLGFKTIIRELYWTKKEEFSKDKTAAIGGFFKQFNTQNLNGFRPNKKISPGWAKVFKKRRETGQKRYLVDIYKKRYFPYGSFSHRGFVFNSEELATIFHIPIKFVKVERMPKIEAKKGGPPSGLPTE
jgi:hypothetical protein